MKNFCIWHDIVTGEVFALDEVEYEQNKSLLKFIHLNDVRVEKIESESMESAIKKFYDMMPI